MSWQRPNWLIILALLATLTPASFVAAATRIIDLSFRAINPGPVNPLRGSFRFECSGSAIDHNFARILTSAAISEGLPTSTAEARGYSPTFVRVNYGSFTKANVLGSVRIDNGAVLKYRWRQRSQLMCIFRRMLRPRSRACRRRFPAR